MSKIAALLNMLSSDNDGERINAARLLTAVAKKENKTIADLVMSPQIIYRDRIVEKPVYRDRPINPEPRRQRESFDPDDLRNYRPKGGPKAKGASTIIDGLRWARDYPEHLNGFESEFIDDVLARYSYDYELSARQEKTAEKIIRKIKSYEDGPLV